MPGKYHNLDISTTLGGENASDLYISSQKATKSYIDTNVSDKQTKKNLTTSLTEESTDTQYPSAKAVYDELQERSGVIFRKWT